MESKQVTEASSNALQEIYDGLSALPTMTTLDVIMQSNRRVDTRDEIIKGVEQYVLNDVKFAGVDVNNQVLLLRAYSRWWRNFYIDKIV